MSKADDELSRLLLDTDFQRLMFSRQPEHEKKWRAFRSVRDKLVRLETPS